MTIFEAFRNVNSIHPDALALIRLTDRYLLIGEDAQRTMHLLNIKPTTIDADGTPLKQISFPHQDLDTAVMKLFEARFRVICEDAETHSKEKRNNNNQPNN